MQLGGVNQRRWFRVLGGNRDVVTQICCITNVAVLMLLEHSITCNEVMGGLELKYKTKLSKNEIHL